MVCVWWVCWRVGGFKGAPHGAAPYQLRKERSTTWHVCHAGRMVANGRRAKVGDSAGVVFSPFDRANSASQGASLARPALMGRPFGKRALGWVAELDHDEVLRPRVRRRQAHAEASRP